MTTSEPSRLDRVEMILAALAESQTRTQQLVEENARGIADLRQSIAETRFISDSNARAIDAWGSRVNEIQDDHEQRDSNSEIIGRHNSRQIDALIDESRANMQQHQEFRQQHQEFLERFDRLLGEIQRIWQRLAS